MHVESSAGRTRLSVMFAALAVSATVSASAATLDRIRESGHLKLGYLADARPFSYKDGAAAPDGYGIGLCQRVAEAVKTQIGMSQLEVDWVPVQFGSHLSEVQQGNVDLLCTPTAATAARRQQVSYSAGTFPGGVRAVLRKDAPPALRDALAEKPQPHPVWRGSPAAKLLETTSFAVVAGTTTETWLAGRRKTLQIDASVVPVADYRAGLRALVDRKADVFFGDRNVVLGAMDATERESLTILDRPFTRETLALALARDDDDFRLLVDRTLSETYSAADFPAMYARWCGALDERARAFFQWNSLMQ